MPPDPNTPAGRRALQRAAIMRTTGALDAKFGEDYTALLMIEDGERVLVRFAYLPPMRHSEAVRAARGELIPQFLKPWNAQPET